MLFGLNSFCLQLKIPRIVSLSQLTQSIKIVTDTIAQEGWIFYGWLSTNSAVVSSTDTFRRNEYVHSNSDGLESYTILDI